LNVVFECIVLKSQTPISMYRVQIKQMYSATFQTNFVDCYSFLTQKVCKQTMQTMPGLVL